MDLLEETQENTKKNGELLLKGMGKMKVYFLKDLSEDYIDAVIISKNDNVTAKDIQKNIDKMKEQNEHDWQWEDIVNCLPQGCEIYDRWQNNEFIAY